MMDFPALRARVSVCSRSPHALRSDNVTGQVTRGRGEPLITDLTF